MNGEDIFSREKNWDIVYLAGIALSFGLIAALALGCGRVSAGARRPNPPARELR
ncbi:MAG: hypothetical protein WC073_02530 [Sterolibacterium sp.]